MGEIRRARNDRTDRGGTARREIRGGEATAGTEGCRGWNRSTRGRRVRNRSVNPKPVRNATRGSSANVDRAATPPSANPMRWRGARGGLLCRFRSLDTRGEKRRRGARTRSVRGSVNPSRATTLAGRTNERRGFDPSLARLFACPRARWGFVSSSSALLTAPRAPRGRAPGRGGGGVRDGVVVAPRHAGARWTRAAARRRRARAGRAGRGRSRARGVGPPPRREGASGRASGIRDDAAGSSEPSAPPAPASRERSPRRPRRRGGWGFVLGSSAPGGIVVIIRRGALINRCASSSSARGAAARPRPAAGERPPRILLVGIDGGGSDPPRAASFARGEGGGVREGARAHLRRCVRGGRVVRRRRARVLERLFRRLPSGARGSPRWFARRKRKRETLGTPLALRLAAASLDRPGPGPGGARGRQGLPRGHARSRLRSRRDALLRAHSSDHGGPGVRDRFGRAGDPRGTLRGFGVLRVRVRARGRGARGGRGRRVGGARARARKLPWVELALDDDERRPRFAGARRD